MNAFRERLPRLREILYVFGGVIFLTYTWAIRGFLYQFSSLRLSHTLGEILAVFSYLMAIALLESLVLISFLIFLGIILPGKWFRDGFAVRGFIATLVAGIGMLTLQYYLYSLDYLMPSMYVIYFGLGIAVLLCIFLIWISQNAPHLRSFLLALQERLQIFMYLYVPLGVIGLAVVIVRNLF